MCEPVDDDRPWRIDETLKLKKSRLNISLDQTIRKTMSPQQSLNAEDEFSFSSEPLGGEDDDEVTESKIRAFLDDKVLFKWDTMLTFNCSQWPFLLVLSAFLFKI